MRTSTYGLHVRWSTSGSRPLPGSAVMLLLSDIGELRAFANHRP